MWAVEAGESQIGSGTKRAHGEPPADLPDARAVNLHHWKSYTTNQVSNILRISATMAQSARQMMGAPPSTASPSDSTLIIIDAQNEYAEGALKVTDAPGTRKVIASLLEKYRAAGGQIVHVVHNVPEGTPIFTPGTNLAKEFDELTPKDGEKVIEKIHPSSFADTTLHDYLRGTGGKKVVLTGYMVCVHEIA